MGYLHKRQLRWPAKEIVARYLAGLSMGSIKMIKVGVQIIAKNDARTKSIQLKAEEFHCLAQQKAKLLKIMELIDIYDQVIDSHVETKSVFYKLSVQSAIEKTQGQAFVQQTRNQLNRSMFNTLNLGKLYLDKHFYDKRSFIKKVTEDEKAHEEVKILREKVFNENTEYMLACELRTYSQHASIMTRTVHMGMRRDHENKTLTAHVSASISKHELCSKIKVSEDKLSRIPDKIDLQKCLDGYIDGISEMHILNLKLVRGVVDTLIKQLESFAQSLAENIGVNISDSYFIQIFRLPDDDEKEPDTSEASISINSQWLDLIRQRQDKHSHATGFRHTKYESFF